MAHKSSKLVIFFKVLGLFLVWSVIGGVLNSLILRALAIPEGFSLFLSPNFEESLQIIVAANLFSYTIVPALISIKWLLFRYLAIINLTLFLLIIVLTYLRTSL